MKITLNEIKKSNRLRKLHNDILEITRAKNLTIKEVKSRSIFDHRASLSTIEEIIKASVAFEIKNDKVKTVEGFYYADISFSYTGNANFVEVGGIVKSANASKAEGAQIDDNCFLVVPVEGSGSWTFETIKIEVIEGDYTKPDKYSGNEKIKTLCLKPKN